MSHNAPVLPTEESNPTTEGQVLPAPLQQALDEARQAARDAGLAYAGGLPPPLAWQLVSAGALTLVDVRSPEEYRFVGHVPDSLQVPWASGTGLTRNPRFVRELEAKLGGRKDRPVLLLCRSGRRSALAAEAAAKAGFTKVYNVLEGFEGDLDAQGQRGHGNGWRFHHLPWQQD
ncbi:rhodanese-like domain-containing protein [Roseateles sp. DAIF2]|uniref:rhodanese-like domain-containing protein n=1 Tax=Roseateles sp. DAIF2 TaxID=2714952 RepID=UPI0018A2EE69|nr:rhodanese-like domain-containing protein [Roseateles sp. DAIF2]QPF73892.1 rhodanese-like domain-containing protein [Roseateles sp. DAIF2]